VNGIKLVPPHVRIPHFKKRERKEFVTIQVGIICPDVIISASDSLITAPYGEKSYEDKISVVNFSVDQMLVAQSGVAAITKRAVQIIQEKAHGKKIIKASDVTKITEEAMREVKDHLSDDDQKEHLKQNGAALMLAFYADGKPYIYRISALLATVEPATLHYSAAGLGEPLANYLLNEFAAPKSPGGIAITSSIYVIKKVKDNNVFCGGDTNVKMLVPVPTAGGWHSPVVGKVQKVDKKFVNDKEKQLVKLDEQAKASWNKRITVILHKETSRTQRYWDEKRRRFLAEIEAEREEENLKRAYAAIHNPVTILKPDKPIENKGENKP
jgi:20S proteasome alpha/beta subunit